MSKCHIVPRNLAPINKRRSHNRIMVGVPMTGTVRAEWMLARYGQVVPCNWSHVDYIHWIDQYSPIRFSVADARNLIATRAVEDDFEWLFFIDHDVVLPPVTLLRINDIMRENTVPIFGGLYFTRSVPSEPLIYRGLGNSYYKDWVLGDKVWVDGMGMGCTLINTSILKALYNESPEYNVGSMRARRIFETPAKELFDPETNGWTAYTGTEDLAFFDRIYRNDIFNKAGWKQIAKKQYPLLMDTGIYCKHIDPNGVQFPHRGEDTVFFPKEFKKKAGIKSKG